VATLKRAYPAGLKRHSVARLVRICSNNVKQLTDEEIDKMAIGHHETMGMKANVAVMQALQAQIDRIEKELSFHCRRDPGYRLLNTVSGIGPILATVILLETGSIDRFADVANYASYCRCVDSIHVSFRSRSAQRTRTTDGKLSPPENIDQQEIATSIGALDVHNPDRAELARGFLPEGLYNTNPTN